MLYLIPLPLADHAEVHQYLMPQVQQIVAHTNYYLVENIRTARRFIASLKTGRNIDALQFYTLDKHVSWQQVVQYFSEIPPDAAVGLMSEAGCPCIADPGHLAVQYAHRTGRKVVPLVGASAVLLALMASGFSGQSFAFHGYLPIQKQERIQALKRLEKDALRGQTQIFMETPYRNDALLTDLLACLKPSTHLCIAANLTAPDAFIKMQTIANWQKEKPLLGKVPAVFLLGSL
ncbi:MAG: SAM-dependent methyltransferase [Cytophagales bacterium]|nr:SAM-dependent methyltransferase [Bernardetiaceae bacterium]MDW8205740.1 SAM-dependent methyltransferase [Cytophagales bacterium]